LYLRQFPALYKAMWFIPYKWRECTAWWISSSIQISRDCRFNATD